MLNSIDEAMAVYQGSDSDEQAVANLLSDLMEYCEEHGIDFDAALHRADDNIAA